MKKRLKTIFILILCITTVSLAYWIYYGLNIAKDDYRLTKLEVIDTNLPEEFSDFKIGFISDINLNETSDINRLETIIDDINNANVDLIIFGGDLYEGEHFDQEVVLQHLKNLKSSYGKFAVLGEKDIVYLNETNSLLQESGFEVLHNEYRRIYYKDATISLFGLESSGDVSGLINKKNQDTFKLVAVHEPDYFDQSCETINLQLSGHSMGGYIQLPLIGAIQNRNLAENYIAGTYKKNGAKLIISNGIGNEDDYSYRFNCPNEVLIITLKNN